MHVSQLHRFVAAFPAVEEARPLLNYLVSLDQHALWDYKAKLLPGLKITENLDSLKQASPAGRQV